MSQKLCAKCQSFFGSPQRLNMCSVCYKQHKQSEKIVNEANSFKIPDLPPTPSVMKVDQTHCFTCKKKIGLLGVHCKHCNYYYCNLHRLLQDHHCEATYVETKQDIKKKTPIVAASKIEHF